MTPACETALIRVRWVLSRGIRALGALMILLTLVPWTHALRSVLWVFDELQVGLDWASTWCAETRASSLRDDQGWWRRRS